MTHHEINPTAASLLGFLHAGPMTGWDLDRAVEATTSNFWNVTRSQIYRELRTLEELGFVEAAEAGKRSRQPYSITPAGRDVFATWIAGDPADATIRMPILLTVFFGEHLSRERLTEIVEDQRRRHRAALEEFRALHDACRDRAPYVASVVRAGIGYHEFLLRWLDDLPLDGDADEIRDQVGWVVRMMGRTDDVAETA